MKTKKRTLTCPRSEYLHALKELTKDANKEFGRPLPKHLRAAIKSHSESLARSRCRLGVRRTKGR